MKYKFTLFKKACSGVLLVGLFFSSTAVAQVSMGKYNTYYSQNFDGLPNEIDGVWASGTEYFTGWRLHRTKTEQTRPDGTKVELNGLVVNTGTSNSGNLYSYGSFNSTDRALGALGSSNAGEFAYGLLLQNNTASNIVSLDLSYAGEQWRSSNSTAGVHHITFWYAISSDKSSFNLWPSGDQGWTQITALTFFSPVYYTTGMTLDGNAAANRKMLSYTLPVNIPAGHYIMLRWKDANEPEADHGLAVDDFSVRWRTDADSEPGTLPVELKNFTATPVKDKVELNWQTASEENNEHFVVERSSDGRLFESIGLLNGNGTSSQVNAYTFTDEQPLSGTSYYRLKQVDTDGTYTYSHLVSVTKAFEEADVQVYPTITTHTLSVLVPPDQKYNHAVVIDVMGKQVMRVLIPREATTFKLDVSMLTTGNYILVLLGAGERKHTNRFVKI